MNHAITLGDILLVFAVIGGLGAAVVGALMFFAGGMSDAPAEGEAAGKQGCITFLFGVVIFAASLWALIA